MNVPSDFVALVRDALERLYDPAYLGGHPLAQMLLPESLPPGVNPPQALHEVLLGAIGRLDPGTMLSPGARQRRPYQILQLRYVEALPFRDTIKELGLSQAQYHRDLHQGLEAVSAMLWPIAGEMKRAAIVGAPRAVGPDSSGTTGPQGGEKPVDLNEAVREVLELLRKVPAAVHVALREDLLIGTAFIRGDRASVRQVVISLVGYVLGAARGGQLDISTKRASGGVILTIAHEGEFSAASLQDTGAVERTTVARDLLRSLGGVLRVEQGLSRLTVTVTIAGRRRSLLVIDDNPGMLQLISRFVADQGYTVLSSGNVPEGLVLAREAQPDVILLDIMMPNQDGWDALQTLKHDPVTQDTPVIVCTILGESDLALALGAAEFIRKPLTRPVLLQALARWSDPQRAAARSPGASSSSEEVDSLEVPGY